MYCVQKLVTVFFFFSDDLRKLSWSGIPSQVRADTWKLLSVSSLLYKTAEC